MTSPLRNEDLAAILSGLLVSSRENRLRWRVYSDAGPEYVADSSRFTYYLKPRDEDGNPPFIFQIFTATDEAGKAQLLLEVQTTRNEAVNQIAAELYETIKLARFGITSLKDDVLRDLGAGQGT
jgi:hypothetical protein